MLRLSRYAWRISASLWRELDTPRSLTCYILASYGEWDQLKDLRVNPAHYSDDPFTAFKLLKDFQATDWLRKSTFLPLEGTDLRADAINKFYELERLCKKTNECLPARLDPRYGDVPSAILDFTSVVRKNVRRLLGPLPQKITLAGFGSGATFESPDWSLNYGVTFCDKVSRTNSITGDAVSILRHTLNGTLLDKEFTASATYRPLLKQCRGDRFTTVPKTASEDRPICPQPGWNMFLQLGVGRHIRANLSRCGYDLRVLQDHHRKMAQLGSLTQLVDTTDLSSASDLISTEVVRYLLPPLWFDLLDSIRTKYTFVGVEDMFERRSGWVHLNKFSAMGNGFTFELETVIFLSIALAVVQLNGGDTDLVSVYGDDIITPHGYQRELHAVLRWFGFIPNPSKSFSDYAFRESCGGDFFVGMPVRAAFWKKDPASTLDWMDVHNSLYERCPFLVDTLKLIKSQVPVSHRRLVGPVGSSGVFYAPSSIWRRRVKVKWQHEYLAVMVPEFRVRPLSKWRPWVQYVAAIAGVPSSGIIPRGDPIGYKIRRASIIHYGVSWRLPSVS